METPPPVNLNALSALLAKSKNVMDKVDAVKPIALSEATLKQTAAEAMSEPDNEPSVPRASAGYTREQVLASKFPQAVKEAMMKSIPNQIANLQLEDTSDLDDVQMTPNKRKPIIKQVVNETRGLVNSNSDILTISRGELKEMINESLIQFLTQSYNKTLTEEAIKKTINMLIKEGKLTVKKKTN